MSHETHDHNNVHKCSRVSNATSTSSSECALITFHGVMISCSQPHLLSHVAPLIASISCDLPSWNFSNVCVNKVTFTHVLLSYCPKPHIILWCRTPRSASDSLPKTSCVLTQPTCSSTLGLRSLKPHLMSHTTAFSASRLCDSPH